MSSGGSGEIRTHGPLSESLVFKTNAINRTLPRFLIWCPRRDSNPQDLVSKTNMYTNSITWAIIYSGTLSQIRTDTSLLLRESPLPIGLWGHGTGYWVRTNDLSLIKRLLYRWVNPVKIYFAIALKFTLLFSGATCRNRTNFLGFSVRCNDHTCSSGMVPPVGFEPTSANYLLLRSISPLFYP